MAMDTLAQRLTTLDVSSGTRVNLTGFVKRHKLNVLGSAYMTAMRHGFKLTRESGRVYVTKL